MASTRGSGVNNSPEMVDTLSVNPVDEVLRQARQLLGTMAPVSVAAFTTAAPAAPPSWDSGAAAAAVGAGSMLEEDLGALRTAQDALQTAVQDADEVIRDAHTRLNAVENAWSSDRVAAATQDSEESKAGLLQAAHTHVQEVTELVRSTAVHFQQAAERVTTAAEALP